MTDEGSASVYAAASLEACAYHILRAMRTDQDVAEEVARHLIRANLSGHDSHGIMRIAQYVAQADRDELVPTGRPQIFHETPTALVVDAQRGFGHFAAAFALDRVGEKAREYGVATAAIRQSTHVGRLGEFTERCTELGQIIIMTVGMAGPGVGGMVIHGGRERFFGANVWSIGVPGATRPMVFDGSMANIAVGKVHTARDEGTMLPPGCLLDRDGEPSVDPAEYYAGGAVVPLGGTVAGHKGYGLALAAALLGGLATIGDLQPTLAGASVREGADRKGRIAGIFILAIDPGSYGNADAYRKMVEDCLDAAKRVPPAKGVAEVMTPGEHSRDLREQRLRDGVHLSKVTRTELAAIARRFNVAMPKPLEPDVARGGAAI